MEGGKACSTRKRNSSRKLAKPLERSRYAVRTSVRASKPCTCQQVTQCTSFTIKQGWREACERNDNEPHSQSWARLRQNTAMVTSTLLMGHSFPRQLGKLQGSTIHLLGWDHCTTNSLAPTP